MHIRLRYLLALGALVVGACSSEPTDSNPTPALFAITPDTISVGSGPQTLVLTGREFVSGSRVRWDGTDIPSDFVSSTELRVAISADRFATPGAPRLAVVNPAPGGGTSGEYTVAIVYPKPTIQSIAPERVRVGTSEPVTIVVHGTGFLAESAIQIEGYALPTTFVSPTQLTATLQWFLLGSARVATIDVRNPDPGGGVSTTHSLVVENPAPVITSISPDSIDADAGATTFRLVGSSFVSGAKLRWNGQERPTLYHGPTELRVQLTEADLANPGIQQISVANPSPAAGVSQTLSLRIMAAPPRITALTPASLVAGSAPVTLNITGTNFASNDEVRWNGAIRPVMFQTPTVLRITLSAADLSAPGRGELVIRSPGSGRSSSPAYLPILPSAETPPAIVTVAQGGRNIVYDKTRDRLYVAVGANSPSRRHTITAINPANQAVMETFPVHNNPTALAISDNDRYLYVGFAGTPVVVRIDLELQVKDLEFPLSVSGDHRSQTYAEDIVVLPGNGTSIAVSLMNDCCSPRHEGVAIYDNGVRRPQKSQGHTGSNRITRGPTPNRLYGLNTETTEFGLRRLAVDAQGVVEERTIGGLVNYFGANIEYDNGYLFSTTGQIFDAEGLRQIARVNEHGLVFPDVHNGRVHYFTGNTLTTYHYLGGPPLGTAPVYHAEGAAAMVRWGTDGIALVTPTSVVLARWSMIGTP